MKINNGNIVVEEYKLVDGYDVSELGLMLDNATSSNAPDTIVKRDHEGKVNLISSTAEKLENPFILSLSGDVEGSVSIDGSENISLICEVVNDSHTHNSQYYTKTELDDKFSTVSTTQHTHPYIRGGHGLEYFVWDGSEVVTINSSFEGDGTLSRYGISSNQTNKPDQTNADWGRDTSKLARSDHAHDARYITWQFDDTIEANLRWIDNKAAEFGTDGDLRIYQNGGTNYIDSSGDLSLNSTTSIIFKRNASKKMSIDSEGLKLEGNFNLYIPEYIYHSGDEDTYFSFSDDSFSISLSGNSVFNSNTSEMNLGSSEIGLLIHSQINMQSNRIEGVGNPHSNDDALNLGFADNRYVNIVGDSMTGSLNISSTKCGLIVSKDSSSSQGIISKFIVEDSDVSQDGPKLEFLKGNKKSWTLGIEQGLVDNSYVIYEDGTDLNIGLKRFAIVPNGDFQFYDGSGTLKASITTTGIFQGTASSAYYADLAEKYTCKGENLKPGTVVRISDDSEYDIEVCSWSTGHSDVVGVISENPAYLMNSESDGVPVALTGKVKVRVIGPVRKGDRLISTENGCAQTIGKYQESNMIFGYSLETNLQNEEKLVLCIIK